MDEFHPSQWLEILKNNPVLIVLIGGQLGGTAVTQAVKLTYQAWYPKTVSDARYHVSLMWCAILSTFLFTNRLWETFIGDHHSGLRHVVAAIAGGSAPLVFDGIKALVRWKWPGFADKWISGNL